MTKVIATSPSIKQLQTRFASRSLYLQERIFQFHALDALVHGCCCCCCCCCCCVCFSIQYDVYAMHTQLGHPHNILHMRICRHCMHVSFSFLLEETRRGTKEESNRILQPRWNKIKYITIWKTVAKHARYVILGTSYMYAQKICSSKIFKHHIIIIHDPHRAITACSWIYSFIWYIAVV